MRKLIFWIHLPVGLIAGLIILVMSVTGVLLTYEKQMIAWADGAHRVVAAPSAGATAMPMEALLAAAGKAAGAAPSAVAVKPEAGAAMSVSFGRRVLFVNPFTGEVLGEGSARARTFFRVVTEWHRYLGRQGDSRPLGKAVTGACNLAFLFLVLSGFYLWWPRKWSGAALRAVLVFNGGLRGKARDWNWHNVIGFWSFAPLVVIVASGAMISYPWVSDLVYRVAGEQPPPRGNTAAAAASRPASRPATQAAVAATQAAVNPIGLDAAFDRARQHASGWRTITLTLSRAATAPFNFTIDHGTGGQPQKRAQLTLDAATGAVTKWEPFATQSPGRRLRAILRFGHTGEVLGLFGQTIAGIVSLGSAVLVYTGFALSWRRFGARRAS